ncbi:MAG: hypothetical protein V2I47_03485 [Bacteroidales bacterium]|jgi:hypothetical protein|nr:hypothetical protein [Bacteroidales bacterium]
METLALILIILAAVFALYWTFRIKKLIPKLINLGMVLGIVILMIPQLKLFETGLYIYLGFLVVAFFYGLADPRRSLIDRLVICLMSAGIFLFWLWTVNHWAGNTIYMPVFVLLIALAGMITKTKLRNELGFLVIITMDAIAILLSM